MSRIAIQGRRPAQDVMEDVWDTLGRRAASGSWGTCPVNLTESFVSLSASQSCGKCVPCRVGLPIIDELCKQLLAGIADEGTLDNLERWARAIYDSADCAIGFEAGAVALRAVTGFREDFESHASHGRCTGPARQAVPCRAECPAQVDIPGYIALTGAGRYADAVSLIRKDNPFPLACGLICEHPCELGCRRGIVDAPINIRGVKRFAVENAPESYDPTNAETTPHRYEPTGKKVAIVGAGPAGLSAAYFLTLMGHSVHVFEQREEPGGMMHYGIPAYRLPREELKREIDWILDQGIELACGVSVGTDITIEALRHDYDAVYLAIGAHIEKRLGIEGEDAEGVLSGVSMLRAIGDGMHPDFTGLDVVVIGGGNVAMDMARSARRLGAKTVSVVYRRRIEDMTAQAAEIESAQAEGCEIRQLLAPQRIVTRDGEVAGLEVQQQIIGMFDRGRPKPTAADEPPFVIPCDRVLVAIGQDIDSGELALQGVPVTRRHTIVVDEYGQVEDMPGVFSGGDCDSGPATVIKAIAAGKAAARNIDDFLGYDHVIKVDIDIPQVSCSSMPACGRSNEQERPSQERALDFDIAELGLTCDETMQEAERCLRCDHYGYGAFRGGRITQW